MNAAAEVAVIFDIDGTLVESFDFDSAYYRETVREVLGDVSIRDSWSEYEHVTDDGILRQIIDENGLHDAAGLIAHVRHVFGLKIRYYLDHGGPCSPVPGAPEVLVHLRQAGFRIGLSTGGWRHTAQMKLVGAGIRADDLPLSSSDDHFDRVKIMEACLERLGADAKGAIYIGDGLWDLEASNRAGCNFVGVGERLRGKCASWVRDFLDPEWKLTMQRLSQS